MSVLDVVQKNPQEKLIYSNRAVSYSNRIFKDSSEVAIFNEVSNHPYYIPSGNLDPLTLTLISIISS